MSTTGDSSWADAGLVPPTEVDLPDDDRSLTPPRVEADAFTPDEHLPGASRPDLRGEADERDVLDQAIAADDAGDDAGDDDQH